MIPDELANRPTRIDSYATRTPSPESLEALARSVEAATGGRPAVVGLSREEFERSLVDSGFLDAEGLQTYLTGLKLEDRSVGVEDLARALVRDGRLTRYQAAALFQGKGKALLIGPYVVLDKLGSGGMGMVFKAKARAGGHEIALKLLPPSSSKHPQAVLRFRREAQIMAKLDHPNVVSSHEIGEFHGVHYLVMDYVEGRDLDRVVRATGPLKVGRAIDAMIQAGHGLLAAHERGIVHRDIKPANLLLDTRGVVRVLDLGLARITRADQAISEVSSAPSLTQSGIIMGTVDFLPPEQSDDSKRADHRADIYSLGCTLYYLLTGKPPYSGDSIMQRLIAHHHKAIPSLIEARPDATAEINAIFQRMLAKSPEDRPQSMAEVIQGLESARSSLGDGRALRVFDDSDEVSKATGKTSSRSSRKPKPVEEEESETYDLLTFVRTELLDESDEFELPRAPEPLPVRKPKKNRRRRTWVDLGIRWLVASASIVVLIRFFPQLPTGPTAVDPPKPPPAIVEPAVLPLAPLEVVPLKSQSPPVIKATPRADSPKAQPPKENGPRPPASELEEPLGPQPRPGPPGSSTSPR